MVLRHPPTSVASTSCLWHRHQSLAYPANSPGAPAHLCTGAGPTPKLCRYVPYSLAKSHDAFQSPPHRVVLTLYARSKAPYGHEHTHHSQSLACLSIQEVAIIPRFRPWEILRSTWPISMPNTPHRARCIGAAVHDLSRACWNFDAHSVIIHVWWNEWNNEYMTLIGSRRGRGGFAEKSCCLVFNLPKHSSHNQKSILVPAGTP